VRRRRDVRPPRAGAGARERRRVLGRDGALRDEEYDHGPIIAQWPVPIRPDDTPDTLAARVLEVEHRLLPLVVTKLARLGVPQVPVRLAAAGSAFVSGDE